MPDTKKMTYIQQLSKHGEDGSGPDWHLRVAQTLEEARNKWPESDEAMQFVAYNILKENYGEESIIENK